jgi:Predicted membrane protein (DUF2254)
MSKTREASRRWLLQASVLTAAALIIFWVFYGADYLAPPNAGAPAVFGGVLSRYFAFDPHGLSDAIASFSGVNVAVFGIVITVVTIIVQLTAERYTGVARMFLRDRVSIATAAYYVVACVVSVWLSASLRSEYVPRAALVAMLVITTGGLVIMAPYFGYVFWFLEPGHIIGRIRRDAVKSARSGALKPDRDKNFRAQAELLFALEELTDITNNSVSGKDKIIASAGVDALKDIALEYLDAKPHANGAWFSIGPEILLNPDFVAMDPESLGEIEARRTWVEWKVMRQYLSIYNEALGSMRDINYLIAIDTRYIGEAAAKANDAELIELVFRYLNSYIRSTLNARDVRTTYNVLNQYRKLAESMMRQGNHAAALDSVKHLKYYGLVSFEMNLSFVTETVAYDIAALAQFANEIASPSEQAILDEFLALDQPPFVREQERALMGVRKAQVKLAAYYLAHGLEQRARSIAEDMREESLERLLIIRRELQVVESKEFWEIVDRGQNFEYMPLPQRMCLPKFFGWLNLEPAPEPPKACEG